MKHPMATRLVATALAFLSAGSCSGTQNEMGGLPLTDDDTPRRERVEYLLGVIAADSMEGRATGSVGSHRASSFLAAELERYGVGPAGEDGFFQPVVIVRPAGGGRGAPTVLPPGSDPGASSQQAVVRDRNVVGLIPGADPALAAEYVVLGAHFDHVGIREPVDGDSIYNGADDDASGTVAVLEVARALIRGERPARSVLVLLTTAEESGMLGTRHFVEYPAVPLESIVADIQVEMIGRPDSLAGGPGRAWLTGYERSTLGDRTRAAGIPLVPDPRPEQNFFLRSDNIVFAAEGIPGHTVSSFNLHDDYHRPSDEVDRVDFEHMTAVIDALEQMVRSVAAGPRPEWREGGRPERRR